MNRPRVYADFHNADAKGRLRLNCVGTIKDLARQHVQLQEGLVLTLYADDADERGQPDELQVTGVVEYSEDEKCWVARIDWAAIRHASEVGKVGPNGAGAETPATHPETR
jgi:hypothetical protein